MSGISGAVTGTARRRIAGLILAVAIVVSGLLVSTYSPKVVHAITTLSQGYLTSDSVVLGSIVSLVKNSSDQVSAANNANVDSILGVVIGDGNSLLSLSTDKTPKQIQVATSGVVQVLVSDINGTINQGDSITASPISGVGMKATDSIKVVGIAQGDLNNGHASKQTYKDKGGQEHSVVLGQIPILVNVSYFYKQPDKTIIPPALQNIAGTDHHEWCNFYRSPVRRSKHYLFDDPQQYNFCRP
jgi:low affinity Fe/Cu permease